MQPKSALATPQFSGRSEPCSEHVTNLHLLMDICVEVDQLTRSTAVLSSGHNSYNLS